MSRFISETQAPAAAATAFSRASGLRIFSVMAVKSRPPRLNLPHPHTSHDWLQVADFSR